MAQAEIKEVLSVDRDKLFEALTRYEDYPKFVEGVKSIEVLSREGNCARVKYHVSVMKDIEYVIDLKSDPAKGVVSWTLAESDFFKKNSGRWEVKSVGPKKTEAHYAVDIEFKIFVPSMILNRLVKGSLPAMLKSFEHRASEI